MTQTLPKGWKEKSLGDICLSVLDGDWIESKDQSSTGIRLIQTGNVGLGQFLNKEKKSRFISEKTFNRLRCTEIFPGDCLVSRLPDPIGRSCLLPALPARMITAVDCSILRFDKKQILPQYFIYHTLRSEYYRTVLKESTGATRKRISRKKLMTLPIPVPPLSEQKRIVEKLDKIFANIDKAKEQTTQNLKNVQEVFEARMDSILKPHSDWHNVKMSEVCDVRDGTHDSPKYIKSGFPLVTSKNLKNGTLVFDNIKYICQEDYDHINERSKVDIGDVLFAMIGTIGNPVVVTEEPRYAIKNMALFKHSKEILPSFLKYILESRVVLDKMQKEANGTTQKFVSLGYLRNFIISLPSIKQQSDIIKELDSLRTKTQELEKIYTKKLADLDELKQSVLQQAFSGKL